MKQHNSYIIKIAADKHTEYEVQCLYISPSEKRIKLKIVSSSFSSLKTSIRYSSPFWIRVDEFEILEDLGIC